MTASDVVRSWSIALAIVGGVALLGIGVQTQQRGGTPRSDSVPPVNDGVNPYRAIRDWAQFTAEDRPWGGSNGVAIDGVGARMRAGLRASNRRARHLPMRYETGLPSSVIRFRT